MQKLKISKNNKEKKGFTPIPILASRCFDIIKSIYKMFLPNVFKKRTDINNRKTMPNLVSGFAVLFSVMLASFLITLGISIFSISLKEIMITISTRDSQIAYYAADSARECVLYWDVKKGAFPPCFDSNGGFIDCTDQTEPKISPEVICNGMPAIVPFAPPPPVVSGVYYTGANVLVDFFKYSDEINSPRADIKITKEYSLEEGIKTTIESYGHNTGVLGRRVERGIKQTNN
jgi:hypothetical protein